MPRKKHPLRTTGRGGKVLVSPFLKLHLYRDKSSLEGDRRSPCAKKVRPAKEEDARRRHDLHGKGKRYLSIGAKEVACEKGKEYGLRGESQCSKTLPNGGRRKR